MADVRDVAGAVAARDEVDRIGNVLRQMARAGVRRVVLCANGCTDGTVREARRAADAVRVELAVVEFQQPLGHDAPRAIAAMEVWRRWPESAAVLMVDADWRGSFGPMLEDLLRDALEHPKAITGVGGRVRAVDLDRHWQRIVCRAGAPASLCPFLLPQVIPLAAFERVSPRFVASPGLFFAFTRRKGIPWRVYEGWDGRLLGNPARDTSAKARVLDLLREDARAAEIALCGGSGHPPLWPGRRDWQAVEAWMSEMRGPRAAGGVTTSCTDPPPCSRQTTRA
ncbi:glycosyltransferase family 2 protein [Alicyclobacillus sendaiensis]|uniref:Glycosyltransferase n=1 Tax=Alicyclobacillus sendaiensis PA2 TaxID=3029425 RepID=A0ABT6XZ57_ALISE|nr:glycosyltransferase family 2 protein [Alicyclobacillus sendaiensis]MDI9260360.1 glycosyltransferase [Alicyclobacillus sendaiensis PA2]